MMAGSSEYLLKFKVTPKAARKLGILVVQMCLLVAGPTLLQYQPQFPGPLLVNVMCSPRSNSMGRLFTWALVRMGLLGSRSSHASPASVYLMSISILGLNLGACVDGKGLMRSPDNKLPQDTS